MFRTAVWGGLAACLLSVSCSFNEPRIRSEPVILQSQNTQKVPLAPIEFSSDNPPTLDVQCQELTSWYTRWLGKAVGGTAGKECVYQVVTQESLHQALLSTDKTVRDNAIMTVLNMSDRSCDNFRAKVFAFRTSANFASGFLNSILSGTGAIASLASGPAGAGLAAANLATGNALNGVNSSYYANKMIDQLDAEMEAQRQQLRAKIVAHLPTATPTPAAGAEDTASPSSTPASTAGPYSGLDAENELQAYDNLCSLETLTRATLSPTVTPTATATATPTAAATPILKVTAPNTVTTKYSATGGGVPVITTFNIQNPKTSGTDVTVSGYVVRAGDGTNGGFVTGNVCAKKISAGDPACSETVTFTPKDLKPASANLKVQSDASGPMPSVTLNGKAKDVTLQPDHGSLQITEGTPASLTLTDADSDIATIKILSATAPGSFTVSGVPASVAKGTPATITINYSGKNPSKGSLVIKQDSANKPLTINLLGVKEP